MTPGTLYAGTEAGVFKSADGGDGRCTVDELLTLVNVALGNAQRSARRRGVPSSAAVDIALLIQAVTSALNGCGGG